MTSQTVASAPSRRPKRKPASLLRAFTSSRSDRLSPPCHVRKMLAMGLWVMMLGMGLPFPFVAPALAQGRDLPLLAFHDAYQALEAGQGQRARALVQSSGDPDAIALIDWLILSDPNGRAGFAEIAAFLDAHPEWPGRSALAARAEEMILDGEVVLTDARLFAWFEAHPPTQSGSALLWLERLRAAGREAEATAVARQAWADLRFGPQHHARMMDDHGDLLRPADHQARLRGMIREDRTDEADRLLPLVGQPARRRAEATLAVMGRSSSAFSLIAALPQADRLDEDLLIEQLIIARRDDVWDRAVQLLNIMPETVEREDDLFFNRLRTARGLFYAGRIPEAYQVISTHRATDNPDYAEGQFFAGWLALRHLNRPADAYRIFTEMYDGVSQPISLGRAAYWAGRAALALEQTDDAQMWFRRASEQSTTFYGQQAIRLTGAPFVIPSGPAITAADRAAFEARPLVRAVRLLYGIGQTQSLSTLLEELRRNTDTPGQRALLVRLAMDVERAFNAVLIAKQAIRDGVDIGADAYPLLRLPAFLADNAPAEAIVHSIIRQESQFAVDIRSPAGALGLMQLMPGTASDTARRMGFPHDPARLYLDAGYNMQLGAQYLGDQLNRFGNNLILAAAAYNAGPGRAVQWIERYGDPRSPRVDLIDWIETIPFSETRNYVMRIAEAAAVYQALINAADSQ